jgi:hypothetical protein
MWGLGCEFQLLGSENLFGDFHVFQRISMGSARYSAVVFGRKQGRRVEARGFGGVFDGPLIRLGMKSLPAIDRLKPAEFSLFQFTPCKNAGQFPLLSSSVFHADWD